MDYSQTITVRVEYEEKIKYFTVSSNTPIATVLSNVRKSCGTMYQVTDIRKRVPGSTLMSSLDGVSCTAPVRSLTSNEFLILSLPALVDEGSTQDRSWTMCKKGLFLTSRRDVLDPAIVAKYGPFWEWVREYNSALDDGLTLSAPENIQVHPNVLAYIKKGRYLPEPPT